jgi:predicted transcriptional regulator of viral defense system
MVHHHDDPAGCDDRAEHDDRADHDDRHRRTANRANRAAHHVAIAALSRSRHGILTIDDLEAHGLQRRLGRARHAADRWQRERRGVYRHLAVPCSNLQRLMLAVAEAGTGAVVSHAAAAALHGITGFSLGGLAHVSIPDHRRRRGLRSVVHRTSKLPDHHCTRIHDIPVTTVARTLFDLCASLHPRAAERALDHALAARAVTLDQCLAVLHDLEQSGRNGTVLFRRLLADRGDGVAIGASELERRLYRLLETAGLPLPDRQVVIGSRHRRIGIVDYWYPRYGIPIEADSRRHHTALTDWDNDRDRDNQRTADGLRPALRFTWRAITREPHRVVDLVHRALTSAGWRPEPTRSSQGQPNARSPGRS